MAHLLAIAIPMILSTSAHAIRMFTDRYFLSQHSVLEFTASMQASITSFTLVCFFIGVAGYANTFVAQYYGDKQYKKIGPSIWQSNYFALVGSFIMLCLIPLAKPLFDWMGHEQQVRIFEILYFKIMCISCIPAVINASLSCFYSGRGKTWTIFWVNITSCCINIVLDYIMIFGKCGLPEMGISGAGWATVISTVFTTACYVILFSLPENRNTYHTLSGWRFDKDLFLRMLRFGCPNGLHFFLDVAGFTFFIMFIGRLGNLEMAASNIAFQLNHLAFFPMIGLGIAISTLTGQELGQNRPDLAVRAAHSACMVSFAYMTLMAIGYVFIPDVFMSPFANMDSLKDSNITFEQIRPMVVVLLRYIALYCLFDTGNIVFSGVLKGAGDTRFVMLCSLGLCWGVMVTPAMICTHYHIGPGNGLYFSWAGLTLFVCLLATTFFLRYRNGKWKHMRVIDQQTVPTLSAKLDSPLDME